MFENVEVLYIMCWWKNSISKMRIPSFELDLELLQIWQGRGWLEFRLKKWNEKRLELELAEVSREMESMLTCLEEMGVDLWKVRIGEKWWLLNTFLVKDQWLRSFSLPFETALLWAVRYTQLKVEFCGKIALKKYLGGEAGGLIVWRSLLKA